MEIGFGAGEHLVGQALANPQIGFIGCEPFLNGVACLLAAIDDHSISNIRIFPEDARLLLPTLPSASIGRIFILFGDPWPKVRHHDRRFVNTETSIELSRILADGGQLRFSSDHMGYVSWTLARVLDLPTFTWSASGPEDWRTPPHDWIGTRYEIKAKAEGRPCVYLTFFRQPRADDTRSARKLLVPAAAAVI